MSIDLSAIRACLIEVNVRGRPGTRLMKVIAS